MQSPAPGEELSLTSVQEGICPAGEQACKKGPVDQGECQVDHEPATGPGSKGQWYPGLHQEEYSQQVHPCPLLSIGEAKAGVLGPVLGFSVQERHEYVEEHPVKGHKDGGLEYVSVIKG